MNQEQLLRELEDILKVPVGSVSAQSRLDDIHWDSMATLEFQAIVDQKYGATIDPQDIGDCESIGDLLALIVASSKDGPTET